MFETIKQIIKCSCKTKFISVIKFLETSRWWNPTFTLNPVQDKWSLTDGSYNCTNPSKMFNTTMPLLVSIIFIMRPSSRWHLLKSGLVRGRGGTEAQKNTQQDDKVKERAEYEVREEGCGGVQPASGESGARR